MKILGKNPPTERLQSFAKLPNFRDGRFRNLDGVEFKVSDAPMGKMLVDFLNKPKSVTPSREVPSVQTDLTTTTFAQPTIIWFGHSSYLIKLRALNILVDPVFSGNASPIPRSVRAFAGANSYGVEHLPPVDVLVLTHDHYDHLDHQTLVRLRGKVKHVVTTLGVGAHLEHWGWPRHLITELNWHQTATITGQGELTAVPAQHMSGRGLRPQRTLWAAFVLQLPGYRLFLGGDSGYNRHFKAIGEQYGPFDLALLENGQYNSSWQAIHTLPEETAQAAVDLQAKMLFPVHWAKFMLAYHPWNEPIKRLLPAADALGLPVTVPRIGEPYTLGEPARRERWWEFE